MLYKQLTSNQGYLRVDNQAKIKCLIFWAKQLFSSALCLLISIIPTLVFAEGAKDPLAASVKPQVAALLGAGSTVAYCIYIAEIVLGSVAYVKTKNLLLLLGVPILMLFTHAMFTYIGG